MLHSLIVHVSKLYMTEYSCVLTFNPKLSFAFIELARGKKKLGICSHQIFENCLNCN